MTRKCFALSLFVTLLVMKGLCQNSVSGIVNTKDNIGLPFATVTLYNDSTVIQNAVADSSGRFTIQAPKPLQDYISGSLKLRAFYKQLTSDWFIIQGNSPANLIINDPGKLLSAVIVEADVSRVTRRGDRFVFTPSKSLTKGADVFDVLRHVPLVKVDDQSEAFAIINKSSTIVYINNKKSDIPKEMMLQWLRSMPADNIISIEVITNPGSEYAANITGGIININMRRGFRDGWQGSLNLTTEQTRFNTTILNGGVTYRKGKFAINLIPFINRSVNYYRLENEVTSINGNINDYNTEYKRKYFVAGGGINMDYQPSLRSYFGIKYWQTNVWGDPELTTESKLIQPGKTDTFINSGYTGKDSYLYNFGNANYRYNIDSFGRSYVDLNIDFNRFRQKRELNGSFELVDENDQPLNPLGAYRNILPQEFWNLSGQLDVKRSLSSTASFLFGVQFSHTDVNNDLEYYNQQQNGYVLDNTLSQNYQYREDYQSAYISMNRTFSKKFSGSAGLRAERTDYESAAKKAGLAYDSIYYNLYPSLSASYAASQKHQFGFSMSRKIIRPNIENLYPGRIYRSTNYFVENNPFLQPTLLLVNELSYLYNRKYSLSLTYSSTRNSNARFVIPVINDTALAYKETLLNYGTIHQLSVVFNTSFNFFKGKWQLYLTPYFNHMEYSGNVAGSKVNVINNDFNLVVDNYIQLSKNKTWAGFITFNYNGPTKDIASERVNALSSLSLQLRKNIKKFTLSLIASDIYAGKRHVESNLYANPLLSGNHLDRYSYTRAIQFKIRYSFGNSNLTATRNRNTANQDIRNRAN